MVGEDYNFRVEYSGDNKIVFKLEEKTTDLKANFIFHKPEAHDSIVMMSPLNLEKTKFYYNVKNYNMLSKGEIS